MGTRSPAPFPWTQGPKPIYQALQQTPGEFEEHMDQESQGLILESDGNLKRMPPAGLVRGCGAGPPKYAGMGERIVREGEFQADRAITGGASVII